MKFSTSICFIIGICQGQLTNVLKKLVLVKISRSFSNFRLKKYDSLGYDTLHGESCFGGFFIDSPGY